MRTFVPAPLPPNPAIEWTADLQDRYDRALLALGRLDSISIILPDTGLFLYSYVPQRLVDLAMERMNPVIDLSTMKFPVAVTSANVVKGRLYVDGATSLGSTN